MAKKRILSYDALKGLAIIAIVAYHLFPTYVPGGFLMVNTFFVISGFFVGRKLESIELSNGKINWPSIWTYIRNTISRIFIPLLWMILLIVLGMLFLDRQLLSYSRTEILSSLFLVNNIFQINAERSYFVQMTDASPFTHLWYNSLYIQFYLISVPIILAMKKLNFSIPLKGIIWSLFVLVSHGLILWLYVPGEDPSRVYYGIGTRYSSFALGIGAVYYIPIILNAMNHFRPKRIVYRLLSFTTFIAMIALVLIVRDQAAMTYYFWMPIFSILSFLLLFSLTIREPLLNWLFHNQLLVMIGQRSYSFYLWYYPIIVFFMSYVRTYPLIYLQIASIVALMIIGELFYQLVERPQFPVAFGLNLNFKENWKNFKTAFSVRHFKPIYLIRSLFVLGLLALFVFAMVFFANDYIPIAQFDLEYRMNQLKTNVQGRATPAEEEMIATHERVAYLDEITNTYQVTELELPDRLRELHQSVLAFNENEAELTEYVQANAEIIDQVNEANPYYSNYLSPNEIVFAATVPVTFFGDSLVYISAPYALDLFQSSNEFGYGSLQIYDAFPILEELIAEETVHDILVINLGTNASLTDDAMEELIDTAGERELFFVNTNSAVQHIEEVNEIIEDFAAEYDNVHEIDWHTYQDGHPEWYTLDEIHHSEEGRDHFAILVARELFEFYDGQIPFNMNE